MSLLQSLEMQQITRALNSGLEFMEADEELRSLARSRAKEILRGGSERSATNIIRLVIDMDRLRLEREVAAAGQSTASIRLSAPANLQDVHALLEAMRNPPGATDATLPQMESIPPAQPQQAGDPPAQSQ